MARSPRRLAGALEVRAPRPEAVPIAGGADLEVEVNACRLRPAAFLDRPARRVFRRVPVVHGSRRWVLVGTSGDGRRQLTKARQ